jgi:hypothetical protein
LVQGLAEQIQQLLPFCQGQGVGVGHSVGGSGQQVADGNRALKRPWQQANRQIERARHTAQELPLWRAQAKGLRALELRTFVHGQWLLSLDSQRDFE